MRIRDARPGELAKVSRLLVEAYGEFRPAIEPAEWEAYLGEIADVQRRLPDSQLIVAEASGRLVGTVSFYLGFRPAPELDVQISGPVARAFRLKL
ncbi:MAG TPA: hypothetical protein VK131_07925 [Candidatus Acidoferrales bacterium]|nr:hypothetical protein [Candidatus Acidoferrales bacterium]